MDYIFYRIGRYYKYYTSILTGEKVARKTPHVDAAVFTGAALAMNLSFIVTIFLPPNIVNSSNIFLGTIILGVFIAMFYWDEERFKRLEQKYKGESRQKLKGYAVLIYLIGSFALFCYIIM